MPNSSASKPKIILIVDDSPDIRSVFTMGLEHFGFIAFSAADAASALSILKSNTIDMAIIDHGLPDKNGLELGLQIRESDPDIKLALLTGDTSQELDNAAMAGGFSAFWVKPVGLNALKTMIDRILG